MATRLGIPSIVAAEGAEGPKLVILGAGGHGRELTELLVAARNAGRLDVPIAGMLDDDSALHGISVCGVRVLGGFDLLDRDDHFHTVLGVGYPEAKRRITKLVGKRTRGWPAAVHPNVVMGGTVEIGAGAHVQAGVVLTTQVRIREFATVNVGVTVSHDCVVGAWATLCPGVSLGGGVEVEEGAFLGIGSTVLQGIAIGAWSIVGAGAVVTEDVPPNVVVVGSPARKIKDLAPGWQDEA